MRYSEIASIDFELVQSKIDESIELLREAYRLCNNAPMADLLDLSKLISTIDDIGLLYELTKDDSIGWQSSSVGC